MPFAKCPIFGGELETKEVEKIVCGGLHAAVLNVSAEVYLHCGKKLYAEGTVRYFEAIRHKLQRQEINDFQVLGNTFTVANDSVQRAL